MYNPSRGGVRGGADQFTWESVKNDKHRENYLGHSLMAPVGRWQKGKDLSWYAKERKDDDTPEKSDKSELASIKKAEEEAMLIALGHNIVRKETQTLSKEDIREALKRNIGDRDNHNIERVDGVGASSQRLAVLTNAGQESRRKKEGVLFEVHKNRTNDVVSNNNKNRDSSTEERKSSKKKSKKHKKEKHKKYHKESCDSDVDDNISKHKHKQKELSKLDSDDKRTSSHVRSHKKFKFKQKDYSSNELSESDNDNKISSSKVRTTKQSKLKDYSHEELSESDCDNKKSSSNVKNNKTLHKYKSYSSNELSENGCDNRKSSSKHRKHKKSKSKHKAYSSDESGRKHHSVSHSHKRHKKKFDSTDSKRRRHDTSDSD